MYQGEYAEVIKKYPVLLPEEERELFGRLKEGDVTSREKLICHNLALIPFTLRAVISFQYTQDELIQEGVLALIYAVDAFDVAQGYKFSSYAIPIILNRIRKYAHKARSPFNIGAKTYEQLANVEKHVAGLRAKGKKEITERDISYGLCNKTWLSPTDIGVLMLHLKQDIPEHTQGIPYNNDVEKIILIRRIRDAILSMQKSLPKRSLEIINAIYGLDGGVPLLPIEVAHKLNISRQRVQQIQKAVIKKLKECFLT